MKPEILLTTPIYAPAIALLEREFTVHRLWTAADPQSILASCADRVRAVVTTGLAGFTRREIEALPRLELIACFSKRAERIDVECARARGIAVTVVPASIAAPVAELALGLLLALMRRIAEADRFVRAGRWAAGPFAMGRSLAGKTCGVVGLGEIGREIARRAAAFGMRPCYHGPREKPGATYAYYADLEAMAAASDCLFVACAATRETENLVDERILRALGPGGWLVNIARGPVVNETALVSAVTNGWIAGAALDVYWDEPRVPAALLALDNVVLTPHIGSSIVEVREERGRNVLANLRAHFGGEGVLTPLQAAC
jgi:hydroxypyruvate reductase